MSKQIVRHSRPSISCSDRKIVAYSSHKNSAQDISGNIYINGSIFSKPKALRPVKTINYKELVQKCTKPGLRTCLETVTVKWEPDTPPVTE